MTNFDKLTAEEIGLMIKNYVMDDDNCKGCPAHAYCSEQDLFRSCSEIFAEWLKSEAQPRLKPCPFCGNIHLCYLKNINGCDVVSIPYTGNELEDTVAVCCDIHDGGCGATSGYYHSCDKAAEKWNKRCCDWDSYDEDEDEDGWDSYDDEDFEDDLPF